MAVFHTVVVASLAQTAVALRSANFLLTAKKFALELIVRQGVYRNRKEQVVWRSPVATDFRAAWFGALFRGRDCPAPK